MAALADEQVLWLYEHLRRIGVQQQLGLWLLSRGGASETPWRLVSLIREYTEKFVVLLPYRAHSAATVVALGADEIVMTPISELGPVDPSRTHPLLPRDGDSAIAISVQDLRHLLKFLEREVGEGLTGDAAASVYTALFEKVHPLAVGALEQTWALAQQISEQVLSTHMPHENEADVARIKAIVERLSDHYKSHQYQINRREAKAMGLNVRNASDEQAFIMWELYLAYQRLQIEGKADFGAGHEVQARRLGHIDSVVGGVLGLGLVDPDKPGQLTGSRWEAKWTAEPAVPPGVQVPPPPVVEGDGQSSPTPAV
ncbi:MAG: hypothetical protein M3256_04080 [Actinomycetota bacterium]|nr:hypothetical protein [Actinomycetota bacterium]